MNSIPIGLTLAREISDVTDEQPSFEKKKNNNNNNLAIIKIIKTVISVFDSKLL